MVCMVMVPCPAYFKLAGAEALPLWLCSNVINMVDIKVGTGTALCKANLVESGFFPIRVVLFLEAYNQILRRFLLCVFLLCHRSIFFIWVQVNSTMTYGTFQCAFSNLRASW